MSDKAIRTTGLIAPQPVSDRDIDAFLPHAKPMTVEEHYEAHVEFTLNLGADDQDLLISPEEHARRKQCYRQQHPLDSTFKREHNEIARHDALQGKHWYIPCKEQDTCQGCEK